MSIAILAQVYEEVRRLSIAGSAVAAGDFRLKKLIPPLEQAAEKALVFAKVAQSVTRLIESNERDSAAALLELSTLVNAILYTQGETGIDGKLQPIESVDLGQQQTQTSARLLKPLLDALSNTGSGRLEVIREAHAVGAFRDLRLISPALAALDDPYPEIADFVSAHVLPLYGKAILPRLREDFTPKGKGGSVRRLKLMYQLDPQGTQPIVHEALEEGSKEVKLAAIACLGESAEDLSFLLEQSKSKVKDVRKAALEALGRCSAADAARALQQAAQGKDLQIAIEPLRTSRHKDVLRFLLDETKGQFQQLLSGKEKDKAKQGKTVERLLMLLQCFRGRDDKQSEQLLIEMFQQREALAKISGTPGGADVVELLVLIMSNGSKKTQRALVDAHASLPPVSLAPALSAAFHCCKPAETFEIFSPYLADGAEGGRKRKRGKPAAPRRHAILSVFLEDYRSTHYHAFYHDVGESIPRDAIDPRWLEIAVQQQILELAAALAVPKHEGLNALLQQAFDQHLKRAMAWEMHVILNTMLRVQHPAVTESVLAAVRKYASSSRFSVYWIGQYIAQLPPEALPEVEALLATLPDRVVDQLVEYVAALKQRAPAVALAAS